MRVYGLIKIKFVFISKKYTPDYLTAWSLVRILFRECASRMSTPGLAMPVDSCDGDCNALDGPMRTYGVIEMKVVFVLNKCTPGYISPHACE